MKKVLFITNIPSPYRVAFFNELGKIVDLTVVFEKSRSDERDNSWQDYASKNFKGIIMSGIKTSVNTALCFEVRNYIRSENWDYIFCCNMGTPTGMIALDYMIRKKIPYIIEGDGAFAGADSWIKFKLKHRFISHASALFSTFEGHDEYYKTYGGKKEDIIRYPFSSVSDCDVSTASASDEERSELRNKLSINENKVVISVGQFIPRKGFDILLECVKDLSRDIGFYLIGGTPPEEYLNVVEQYKLENVHFIPFKKKNELKEYYRAGDLFILPTREDIWGLVVNEAMALGLPVISTTRCGAAIEMVKNGVNGYLVPTDSKNALCESISVAFADEPKLRKMGDNAIKTASQYTIEKMAQKHIEYFIV